LRKKGQFRQKQRDRLFLSCIGHANSRETSQEGHTVSLATLVLIRGVIAFIALLIFTNILGKEQISKLTFSDFITGITIGNLAAAMTVDFHSRAWPHFVGLAVWVGLALLVQLVTLKSRWLAKALGNEPAVLMENGHILETNMARVRYRYDDLLTQLRENGVFDLNEVEMAILEPNGQLSVLKRSQFLPVTPHDLNMSTTYKGLPTELIYDGEINDANLKVVRLTRGWLMAELHKRGIPAAEDVTLALLGTDGELFVDTRNDPPPFLETADQPQMH
jgi:uncharacterized membrane protein YcaP (DUF421 family)